LVTRRHLEQWSAVTPAADSTATTATEPGWLSRDAMEQVRGNVPLVYVDAIPVRLDGSGNVTELGLLLRQAADGTISRMFVSGRVQLNERVREALIRHLEKDLGPLAMPQVPPNPAPFTVVEYFQDPDRSGFHDPRHHAVSLAYVVPVAGDCQPTQEALDLAWYSPSEAVSGQVIGDMTGGHDRLLRLALAHVGQLPCRSGRAQLQQLEEMPPRAADGRDPAQTVVGMALG